MTEIRDRLAQIAEETCAEDWTWDDIADAILDEFIVYERYRPELVREPWDLPNDPFDITEWLPMSLDRASAEESGAEHELDYYTDHVGAVYGSPWIELTDAVGEFGYPEFYTEPDPYAGPQLMWRNPYYTGYRTRDGVVRVYRSDEKPPDIERFSKKVEQFNRVVEKLSGPPWAPGMTPETTPGYLRKDEHPIDVVSDYDAENAVVDEIVHQVSHKYTLSDLFGLRNTIS